VQIEVYSREECLIINFVLDRQSFFLIEPGSEKAEQRQPRAIVVSVDRGFIRADRRRRNGARRRPELFAQIRAVQFFPNAFEGEEVKRLVFLDWTTNRSAVLFTIKTVERSAVGCVRSQRFETLQIESAAVNVVCARLLDDVDHATGSSSKLSARSARNNLKLFHCFEGDIDCGALPAELFAEESVVVVAAIKTDVVEDSTLAREVDLIAVGTLCDADVWCECQQVFKLPSENRCRSYCCLVHRRAGLSLEGVDGWSRRDGDAFLYTRDLQRKRNRQRLAHR